MKKKIVALNLLVLFSCCQSDTSNKTVLTQQQIDTTVEKPVTSEISEKIEVISYRMVNTKQWLLEHKVDSTQEIVFAINRTDRSNLYRMDSVMIPSDLSFSMADYLPFPLYVYYLKDVDKIIYFSYPTQTFGAYQNGKLIHAGPTNMGRESHLTPTGLFFTNWKAKVTTSTVNAEWILNWNFNIINKDGVGWHQYSLPGYPISHSCLRLQEKDAFFLYNWADQWVLANSYTIKVKGTPVIIYGAYDFGSPKPWLKLVSDPHSMDISLDEIQKITQSYLNEILSSQKHRDTFQMVNNKLF